MTSRMRIRPCTLAEARAFVSAHHRHNKAPAGHKVSVRLVGDDDITLGVGVLSRPVARMLDDGSRAEITRVCTLGAHNGCSMIYGALLRVAKALGYWKVYTYTQSDETGASPKAAGFLIDERLPARRSWAESSRLFAHLRDPKYRTGGVERIRWCVTFAGNAP